MNDREALDLLRAAIPSAAGETWADLGAGTGTFTRALATLAAPGGRVIAVDADAGALEAVRAWAARAAAGAAVAVLRADIAGPLELPPLDGMVMANVLHFVRDQPDVLARLAAKLRPRGRMVLIEYEGRRPSRWVPYPVSLARFAALAADAGLAPPRLAATRPSAFGGELYVAVAERAAA